MPPAIATSPIYNIQAINTLLASPVPQPLTSRIQLLSAKIHLLTNDPPSDPLSVLRTRRELGELYLKEKHDLKAAEIELSMVQRECKDIVKRIARERRLAQEGKTAIKSQDEVMRDEEMESSAVNLRVESMRLLVQVEEELGREGRAETWRKLIQDAGKTI
ncbi:hypothetical protein B9479_000810 [Cryptococcus floricola]|uniref:Uncharacterized protein n=1 Tax=Cryptococcus floricola TaxID=2591691 RepID=A0A5D3B7E8_9TREE|nr:hypothetical protein B9479_000810 [Cryptococcus floricola]